MLLLTLCSLTYTSLTVILSFQCLISFVTVRLVTRLLKSMPRFYAIVNSAEWCWKLTTSAKKKEKNLQKLTNIDHVIKIHESQWNQWKKKSTKILQGYPLSDPASFSLIWCEQNLMPFCDILQPERTLENMKTQKSNKASGNPFRHHKIF